MGNNLDKELAEAAGLGEDNSADTGSTDTESTDTGSVDTNDDASMAIPADRGGDADGADSGSKTKNLGMLAALLVMVGVIVALFMFGIDDVEVYSMTLEKFDANKAKYTDRRVRIEGELVPNSLKKRDSPCEYRFKLRDKDARIDVRFPQCIVPEAFVDRGQPGVMVTAEGKMNGDHFEASNIMAKCASKYDPETHTLEGQEQAKAPAGDAPAAPK